MMAELHGQRAMQIHRFFSSKLAAVVGSLVIAICLTFTTSAYEAARGLSITSANLTVSNTASKGDRLTSSYSKAPAFTAAGPEQVTAKHSGKIPIGCETAVSRFVHSADLRARRCVT